MSPPQEKGLGPGVGLGRRSGWTGCFHCPSSLLPATPPNPPTLISLLLCFLGFALKGKPGIYPVFGVLFHQDQNNIT